MIVSFSANLATDSFKSEKRFFSDSTFKRNKSGQTVQPTQLIHLKKIQIKIIKIEFSLIFEFFSNVIEFVG